MNNINNYKKRDALTDGRESLSDLSLNSDQSRVTYSRSQRHHLSVQSTAPGEPRRSAVAAIDAMPSEKATYCTPATQTLVASLFDRWNNALKSGDPRKVVKCYSEDAVLLPTVSNIPRTNHDEIQDYFEHFLVKKPVGKILQRVVKIGCNKITDAGIYEFRIEENGVILNIPARYTFVYESIAGDWLIAHHHSSAMPE